MLRLRRWLHGRLDRLTCTSRGMWWLLFLGALVVYLPTSRWHGVFVNDAEAASWPGYALAHHGTMFLDGLSYERLNPWIGHVHGHVVALRTPGVILAGLPVPLALGWTGLSLQAGSALAAGLFTAAAMANLGVLLSRLIARPLALAAAATFAFGTAAWTVGSAELWTHGPDLFWLSAALLAAAANRHLLAGTLLGAAILTREHFALVAAAVGVCVFLAHRSWRALLSYAVPAVGALGLIVLFNLFYLGHASLEPPGYSGYLTSGSLSPNAPAGHGLVGLLFGGLGPSNLAGAFFSAGVGVFAFTPVAVPALLCCAPGWRGAPAWARGAFLGAVAYAVLQNRLNLFQGGSSYYGNRLMLEPLLLCTPLAVVGYARIRDRERLVRAMTRVTALASVAIYSTGALLTQHLPSNRGFVWQDWGPRYVVEHAGHRGTVAACVGLALAVLAQLLRRPAELRLPAPASAAAADPVVR